MVQRIVCFKFKPGITEAEITAHMAAFADLQAAVPVIVHYRGGRTMPGENDRQPDYDSLHYLTFEDRPDIDTYFHHAAHQQFIADHQHLWDRVLVLNAAID